MTSKSQPKRTAVAAPGELSIERPETAQRPQVAIDPAELGLPPAVGDVSGEETVTVTKAELADLVATATAAAVAAQAKSGATPAKVQAAALKAVG